MAELTTSSSVHSLPFRQVCPLCGRRRYAGRGRIHDTGQCVTPWYQRERGKHPFVVGRPGATGPRRKPGPKLSTADDLSPEQIERIMQRRALEQRYERVMQQ